MRTKLNDRRFCANLDTCFTSAGGRSFKLTITIGFDIDYNIKEVFCADFKAGSDNQSIIMDACILLSRLLQHGDTPADLLTSMCSPPSLIGTICKAIVDEQQANPVFGQTSHGLERVDVDKAPVD